MVLCWVILTFGHPLDKTDIWSDVASSRVIWWPRIVQCQVILIFGHPLDQADIWSDVLPVDTSGGQEWYYVRSS